MNRSMNETSPRESQKAHDKMTSTNQGKGKELENSFAKLTIIDQGKENGEKCLQRRYKDHIMEIGRSEWLQKGTMRLELQNKTMNGCIVVG